MITPEKYTESKTNIVFDIDNVISFLVDYQQEETINEIQEELGKEFIDRHLIMAIGYPHLIFPGFYALFQWMQSECMYISIFSSGVEQRNVELVDNLITRAFPDCEKNRLPDVKVFSRHHCLDTDSLMEDERKKYQSLRYGHYKKVLANVVVPKEHLMSTFLIDDDLSYMPTGEEKNMIFVASDSLVFFPTRPAHRYRRTFEGFHKAYYICGLLCRIGEVSTERNITLVDAANFVQVEMEGKVFDKDFFYPSTSRIEYYERGLETLQKFDTSLKFYFTYPTRDF